MKLRPSLIVLLIISAVLHSGCASVGNDAPEKTAQQLIEEGMALYDDGDYKLALESFRQLKDWYPFSKHAVLAELKIADSHYYLKEYPDAVIAYEEFERLHPRNASAPYVIYQIGRCYFDQIGTVDREQSATLKAVEVFERLGREYPDDPYTQKARAHQLTCYQSLAGHEYYVGRFYYKQRLYRAALHRFLSVVNDYPDVGGYHYKALHYIAECEAYRPVDTMGDSK
ncbi:MAG: outer membrane protein assembly factor BamD [Desulfatitalea sp.]|nr:outer membrane protein assembly factor BamD [Desulfatitalea sp.]NNK01375.1 outer membrane protein assembly factor BamD [Desulfatitalea sp.]